jgi:hypothetical protein
MNKLILFLASVLLACNPSNDTDIKGVWKLSGIEDNHTSDDRDSVSDVFAEDMLDYVAKYYNYSFINFYSDTGCIIRKGSEFIHADWKINEIRNTIVTKAKSPLDQSKKETIIKVIADSVLLIIFKPDTGIISFYNKSKNNISGFENYIKNNEFIFMFKKDRFEYFNEKDDIYSYENNCWQIRPSIPETNDQIKSRLRASINYTKILINDAFVRGTGKYNTRSIIAPIKLYKNGIGLIEKEKISSEWVNTFYSRDQAMIAYQMLNNSFDKKVIPVKKDNWVLTDIDLLRQLIENLY